MSFGGSKQSQNEKGETAPWVSQQPYLLKGWDEAAKQLDQGSAQPFPISPVTPYSDQSLQGLGMMEGIASQSRLPEQAARQAGDTASGAYQMSPDQWSARTANPYMSQSPNGYIDNVANAVRRQVTPGVQSAYGAAGRGGESPLAQTAIAKGVSDSLAPLMFGSAEAEMGRRFQGGEAAATRGAGLYEGERGRQMQATSMSPSIEQGRYAPAEAMLKAGALDEAKQNEYMQAAMGRWQQDQAAPAKALNDYTNIIQGTNFGSQFAGVNAGTGLKASNNPGGSK